LKLDSSGYTPVWFWCDLHPRFRFNICTS